MNVEDDSDRTTEKTIDRPLSKGPISWGVSSMALAQKGMDSETLLRFAEVYSCLIESLHRRATVGKISAFRSCTKKLQSLEYVDTGDSKVSKRAHRCKREKTMRAKEASLETEEETRDERKSRKKLRYKWQKVVNIGSKMKEACHRKTSFLTINADSLRLVTAVEIPSKSQARQRRVESRRKHRRSNASCSVSNVDKISVVKSQSRSRMQLQPLIIPLCDSFSSDNDSTDPQRKRVSKKKQKKKQSKNRSTSVVGRKKRANSAKPLRNF